MDKDLVIMSLGNIVKSELEGVSIREMKHPHILPEPKNLFYYQF